LLRHKAAAHHSKYEVTVATWRSTHSASLSSVACQSSPVESLTDSDVGYRSIGLRCVVSNELRPTLHMHGVGVFHSHTIMKSHST